MNQTSNPQTGNSQPIVILKFGGKLLESSKKIIAAANYAVSLKLKGELPVVVVSAIGISTDDFIRMAKEITPQPDGREMDMLLSVGERIAIALVAMAINADGRCKAISLTGSQVGIITDTQHTDARIIEVKGYRIREVLSQNQIPIIAGFQGISTEKEITTLGRGGSDATAVALSVALGAKRCELVKEVGGIYSADPHIVDDAVLRKHIDYTALEELTAAGAKVVQPRAAALAKEHRVPLAIAGIDGQSTSTLVTDHALTGSQIVGLTLEENLFSISLDSMDDVRLASGNRRLTAWNSGCGIMVVKDDVPDTYKNTVSLISLIGWGGVLSKDVIELVIITLQNEKINLIAIAGIGGRLALAVAVEQGKRALRAIHRACVSANLIE